MLAPEPPGRPGCKPAFSYLPLPPAGEVR
ncbi:hypothetical protein QMO37_32680, partial [Pseudomonas aeruginosa]